MMSIDQQLKDVFLVTRATEAALRQAIRTDLDRAYGPLWYSLIPDDMKQRWARSEQQDKEIGMPTRNSELLDYATLDELAAIINRYPEAFEPRFGNIELFQGRLNEFRLLRNALMHGAELPEESNQRLATLAEELKAQCFATIRRRLGFEQEPVKAEPRKAFQAKAPLNEAQLTLLKVVQQATAQMSGVITGEREALMDYLQDNQLRCSPEALSYVREKFASLTGTISLVDRLLSDLAPPQPEIPKPDWKVTQWLNWASRSYMPYRRWLIRHGLTDENTEKMALAYEDWLRQSYPQLLRSEHDALVVGAYKWIKQQLEKGMRVLWLVVDNLCGLWQADFVELLLESGIQVRESRRMLALLPSTAAISRRAMLAGRLPTEALQFADDETACRQLWREQGTQQIAFCTSIRDAEFAIKQNVNLIVLIDNWLDTLAHLPEQPGFDRDEQMLLKMGNLAVKVGNLLRQMSAVAPTRLVISTDHGAIFPTPTSQIIAVPASAIPDNEVDRHQRFSIVRDVSGLNPIDWHILDAELYGLPWTCAVVRGQRYIGNRLKSYTHGGLSPEETVLRLLVADIGEREPLELVLTQATPEMRLGRPDHLAILVRNPFNVPVENLELALPDLQVRFEALDVPPRSEATTVKKTITLPAKLEVRDSVSYIRITGHFQITGKPTVMPLQRLRINVRELYRSSMDDLGDLLHD